MFSRFGENITGVCRLKHSGLKLTHYLREGSLVQHGLIAAARKGKVYLQDGTALRLTYVPRPGDIIVLKR